MKEDNELLNTMFALLNTSSELTLIESTFNKSKHEKAIKLIHKQLSKTTLKPPEFLELLTISFIEYLSHSPQEDGTISNLLDEQTPVNKIKIITLIYLHLLTDVYSFSKSWALARPGSQ